MSTRTKTFIIAAAMFAWIPGCGASISTELVNAREAFHQAERSSAATLNPDELLRAQRTLEQAEAAADGSLEEQTLAYVADRQARLAVAHAEAQALEMRAERDEVRHRDLLERQAIAQRRTIEAQQRAEAETQSELERVRAELRQRGDVLDDRTRALREREQELARRVAELDEARRARDAAETRAERAMTRPRELAAMRQTETETIITLSGEVLFETDESSLRPTAEERLREVAVALRDGETNGTVRIVGHTDTRGSAEHNRQLSRERAASVRDYLVSEGVDAERLEIEGRGERSPVAPNDTAEGRANNRRVEIRIPREGNDE